MESLRRIYRHIAAALHSGSGRNAMLFLAFLALSTVLWCVMALNDEDQTDVRLPLRITNIPDTVTFIATPPPSVAVSLRARASQLIRFAFGHVPTVNLDFREFRQGNTLRLTDADLKALVRSTVEGSVVTVVNPDSINLRFTTAPGRPVPVRLDYDVTPAPKAIISRRPRIAPDSVLAYTASSSVSITSVTTEPVRIASLAANTVRRVRLVAPRGVRLIPDSVDVTFFVESLIRKTRMLNITAIGVPADRRLITFPAQVEVSYLMPVSDVKKNVIPAMRAVVDYRSIPAGADTRMVRVRLLDVPDNLSSVRLASDSVEYIIERL